MNLDTIIVLFVLPLVAVLLSLILNVLARRGEKAIESGGHTAFEIALISSVGVPGILFFILVDSVREYGVQIAFAAFGYILGLIAIHAMVIHKHENWRQTGITNAPVLIESLTRSIPLHIISSLVFVLILGYLAFFQLKGSMDFFATLIFGKDISSVARTSGLRLAYTNFFMFLFFTTMLLKANKGAVFQNWVLKFAGIITVVFLLYIIPTVFFKQGGLSWILNSGGDKNPLLKIDYVNMFMVSGGLFFGLVTLGQPHYISYLIHARSKNDIAVGGIVAVCIATIISWMLIYSALASNELNMYVTQYTRFMALPLFVLLFNFIIDIASQHAKPELTEGNKIAKLDKSTFFSRILFFILFSYITLVWWFYSNHNINPSIFPYILLSCAIGPSILVAFFKRISPWAALTGMISGIIICVGWHYFRIEGYRPYGLPMIHEIIPGFFIPLLLILLIDRLSQTHRKN